MRINNKFVVPNFDRLICCFDNHYRNSSKPSKELSEAIDELFDLVKNIKPLKDNDEIKMGSPTENKDCYDEFAIGLIKLLIIAINDIINFIKSNKYIELINKEVPYKYRKGYYFVVAGKSFGRAAETVNFYVAIKEAGYPIIIEDGDAMLARYKATDYVGIVPHLVPTRYCESLFDKKYGTILDFMHVYDDDLEKFGDKIEWIELET